MFFEEKDYCALKSKTKYFDPDKGNDLLFSRPTIHSYRYKKVYESDDILLAVLWLKIQIKILSKKRKLNIYQINKKIDTAFFDLIKEYTKKEDD